MDKPITDWVVYVKSPHNPRTLLLFNNFHRIVYEEKMASFHMLCCKLGASEAAVYYVKSEGQSINSAIQVDGAGLKSYASASGEAKTAISGHSMENVKTVMRFNDGNGSSTVHAFSSPWFDKEPTWRAMYEARRNRSNSVTEFTADFHYTEDFRVNVTTKAAFESADYKIAASAEVDFQMFTNILWEFRVKFPPAKLVLPEWWRRRQ